MPNKYDWEITIIGSEGFVPSWFENSYPFYGNKGHASDMKNINIIDPNVITQGPGIADLTNIASVTTLIRGILRYAVSTDVSYACGGNKYYKISSSAIGTTSPYPYTIDKAAVTGEDAEDVFYYKSKVYVFYNHSGSAGDILQDNAGDIDVDWGSTVPTGKGTLQSAPHQAINGGDDDAYFTNGQYVGAIRANGTLELQALDFWTNAQTVSITWNGNRVVVAVNRPNVSGSNFNQSGIYNWNGVSSSWEGDPVEVSGRIGALYTKNGRTFVWWQEGTDTGAYVFGYVSGTVLEPIRKFKGSLPLWYQVGEYRGFISWVADNLVYLYGSKDVQLPVALSQFCAGKRATIGGIASPFGDLLVASYVSTTYSLGKPSGYTTDSTYNTIAYRIGNANSIGQIALIQVETEQMSSGARCDLVLTYDKGKSTLELDPVEYSPENITRHKILGQGPAIEDFLLSFDFSNGSTVNPVKIRSIYIAGWYTKSN